MHHPLDNQRSFAHHATDYLIVLITTNGVGFFDFIWPRRMGQAFVKIPSSQGLVERCLEMVEVVAFGVAVLGFPAWVFFSLQKLLVRLFLKHIQKLVDWLFECHRNANSYHNTMYLAYT